MKKTKDEEAPVDAPETDLEAEAELEEAQAELEEAIKAEAARKRCDRRYYD